jgi:hypothetical protein
MESLPADGVEPVDFGPGLVEFQRDMFMEMATTDGQF